jgi:hypothetical protein
MAFRSYTSSSGYDTTSLAISKPVGTVVSDVMVAHLLLYVYGITITVTPPAGWTLLRSITSLDATMRSYFYYKAAGSSEPANYTWSFSTATSVVLGAIRTHTDISVSSPINVENGQATGRQTSHSTPSVTTTKHNCELLTLFGCSFTTGTPVWDPPAGETENYDLNWIEGSNEIQAVLGASGAKTAVCSLVSSGMAEIIALSPVTTQLHTMDAVLRVSNQRFHTTDIRIGVTERTKYYTSDARIYRGHVSCTTDAIVGRITILKLDRIRLFMNQGLLIARTECYYEKPAGVAKRIEVIYDF